nr:immunoglobulin light chain junction region [Macaca mulatta]
DYSETSTDHYIF